MTREMRGALIVAGAAMMAACTSSRQSAADTTAAASSTIPAVIPAVGAAVGDSLGNRAAVPQSSASAEQSAPTATHGTNDRAAPTASGTSRNTASESNIIGRDSVVRRRVRGLPTATSTPIRR
jgi:hypothetical protein